MLNKLKELSKTKGIESMLILCAVSIFFSSLLTFWSYRHLSDSRNAIIRSYQSLQYKDAVRMHLLEIETNAMRYTLTGEAIYLEPFQEGTKHLEQTLIQWKTANGKNDRVELFTAVENHARDLIAFWRAAVSSASIDEDSLSRDDIQSVVSQRNQAKVADLNKAIASFEEFENEALTTKIEELESRNLINKIVQWSIGIFNIIIVLLAMTTITRQRRDRREMFHSLDQNNRQYLLDNGEVARNEESVANLLIENLRDATTFVNEIGKGNYEAKLSGLNASNLEKNKDNLAGALVEMKVKMKQVAEEEKKRTWANQGLAELAEILRKTNHDLNVLADQVITYLVKYMKANQGGVFIVNDEDQNNVFLELSACYAFERKKYLTKTVLPGEGLVGQTYLEQDIIHLRQIPQEYVRITSGLGGANPDSLLLVPLKTADAILGVIEIASFKPFQEHEVDFIQRVSESIASTISGVKINQRTRILLEQFQQQTEEMRAQEEEMRQNMEELQATQEEIARKERESVRKIAELEEKLSNGSDNGLLTTQLESLKQKEQEYLKTIQQLEDHKRNATEASGWEEIEALEQTFRKNLEALKVTQDELERKLSNN